MHPFSDNPDETVASLGEKRLLKQVRDWLGDAAPAAPFGMGDDCAEIPDTQSPTRLITTDSVVYGRHFDDTAPPPKVGAKLLKRNLSDIAAMGGTPTQAVIAGFLPRRTRLDWLEACLRGIAECALAYGVQIVGGDLAESESDLALNLTLLGTGDALLYRTGGRAGDWICVTGPLGGSRASRHLDFVPRLREGSLLAGRTGVHACIDISDGLIIDLLNILPESCSASIEPDTVPVRRKPPAHPESLPSGMR
jgi:thiamine-monophosphate kinase